MSLVPHRAAALAAGAFFALAASAQPVTAPVENTYARPGYPTVAVYAMGDVTTPGKWRVEDGAPLMDLLAVTRPVTPAPMRGGVREHVRVRLYRQSGTNTRQLAVDSELEPLLLGPLSVTPLREGDLVQVTMVVDEPRNRLSFIDILGVVGTLASLGALVVSVAR